MLKKALLFKFSLLLVSMLFLQNSGAQDYTQWGLPEGAKARLGKGHINEMQYSPDGTVLAVASSIGIWLYDAAPYKEVALLTGRYDVMSVSFSPDGRMLASADWNGTIRLWDVATGTHKKTLSGHTNLVTSVSFSPDGRTLASTSWDGTVLLWELAPSANTTPR